MIPAEACRPVRWRLALVTWAALGVVVSLVSALARPVLAALPAPLDVVVLTGLVVVVMTWLVMPVATRRCSRFLTPTCRPTRRRRAPVDA